MRCESAWAIDRLGGFLVRKKKKKKKHVVLKKYFVCLQAGFSQSGEITFRH